MTRVFLRVIIAFAAAALCCMSAHAQTKFAGVVSVDKTVHDWGDVTVKDGPLDCTFTLTNISDGPVVIRSVTSSCGCTGVVWTREPISPGQSGTVKATYSNDEGPYAFDKVLTVSVEGVRKPLILHLRGVVHPKKLPLKETYPVQFDALGFRDSLIKVGNLSQGEVKSAEVRVANVGKKPITVSFSDVSPFLSFTPAELRIDGNSTATLGITVQADRSLWGENIYTASPVVNGRKQEGRMTFKATTRENFDTWTPEQLRNAPVAQYEGSVVPDPVKAGTPITAKFEIANKGKSPLKIYKVDAGDGSIRVKSAPASIKTGGKGSIEIMIDTSDKKPDSEYLGIVTLYTNDPSHGIIHLYIDAIIL